MKKIFILLLFPSVFYSQITEEVINEKGEVIIVTQKTNTSKRTAEETVELFYKNHESPVELDKLVNADFHMKTPSYQFIEVMTNVFKIVGKYIDRKLIEKTILADNVVKYRFEVTYEKRKCIEEITLIQKNEKKDYKIKEYIIK